MIYLFTDVRISTQKFLLLANCFAKDMSFQQTIDETTLPGQPTTSRTTASDWRNYFREVIVVWLEEFQVYQYLGLARLSMS